MYVAYLEMVHETEHTHTQVYTQSNTVVTPHETRGNLLGYTYNRIKKKISRVLVVNFFFLLWLKPSFKKGILFKNLPLLYIF